MRLTPAVLLAVPLLAVLGPAHADVRADVDCAQVDATTEERYRTDRPSRPLALLGVEAAHAALGDEVPGEGVSVAVVDSGVHARSRLLEVVEGRSFTGTNRLLDGHGSIVAGLVAGGPRAGEPTGVAPGARIVDVRVYDQAEPTERGAVGIEVERVARGLRWVAANAGDLGIGVVTVALRLPHHPRLAAAVRALDRADVVVVAASGNRPEEGDPLHAEYGTLKPGEDAADVVYPAGYADVVAVSATAGGHPDAGYDVRSRVLQSTATDVAAPTYGAVSVALNGSTCLLRDVATSWAAAEVSGVVALLRDRYPDDTADQVVARLRESASGAAEDRNVLTGAGVVQPLEALTRPLRPGLRGEVARSVPEGGRTPPATAPGPQVDALAQARHDAVWWGLLGGGAVVLGLLLRPVLARRPGRAGRAATPFGPKPRGTQDETRRF